jgi:hypothetical protein
MCAKNNHREHPKHGEREDVSHGSRGNSHFASAPPTPNSAKWISIPSRRKRQRSAGLRANEVDVGTGENVIEGKEVKMLVDE